MVARAFPIDFGESGATLQGAFRVLDRILSLGVVSDSTGISPTQLPKRPTSCPRRRDSGLVHTSRVADQFRHADLWGLILPQHFDDMPTIHPSGFRDRRVTGVTR